MSTFRQRIMIRACTRELANGGGHPIHVGIVELLQRETGGRRNIGQADARAPAPSGIAKPFSAARQPISAQTPPIHPGRVDDDRRPVFLSDFENVCSSSGLIVRRSITSASIPSRGKIVGRLQSRARSRARPRRSVTSPPRRR